MLSEPTEETVPLHTNGIASSSETGEVITPAIEKLHMHWSSHMDQYSIFSHPSNQSALPYLISSQPRIAQPSPWPAAQGGASYAQSEPAAKIARETRPLPRDVVARGGWKLDDHAYGRDPNWREEQISFLHTAERPESSRQAAIKPAHYADRAEAQRTASVHHAANAPKDAKERTGTGAEHIDQGLVQRVVPAELRAYFAPPSTSNQPHLDAFRERKHKLERDAAQGDAAALAEIAEARGAKRKAGSQGLLSDAEKKANHIASEQKRRANIRKGYDMLSEVIPTLVKSQEDNSGVANLKDHEGKISTHGEITILEEAVDYLNERLLEHQHLLKRKAEIQLYLLSKYSEKNR
ncbi:hypothetical protein MVES1_001337 [Malassezia vespertilionis]|uniref:BHLH domain-containing protein n=1 Tax=Malassezia vespertilionis TaxID=2020962 RepID=A0A2N1JEG6_9BASI|nr:uncharacterized protein MVES1_001337 [Malassezia vespertilionis]PKI84937.1 hypothetical protein MVES_001256 [Malassezia vespertilionis]WFD05999.1 hypothetical protein MVES1_001337 [Malassezia vespertilionis]